MSKGTLKNVCPLFRLPITNKLLKFEIRLLVANLLLKKNMKTIKIIKNVIFLTIFLCTYDLKLYVKKTIFQNLNVLSFYWDNESFMLNGSLRIWIEIKYCKHR